VAFSTITLGPPWTRLWTTPGAGGFESFALPSGPVGAASGAGLPGSAHNWGMVSATFAVPAGCTLLVAAAPVSVSWFAWIWAWGGYFSAEALVGLWLADRTDVGEQRVSLARPIAPYIGGWSSGDRVTPLSLTAALTRSTAAASTAEVGVYVESWAGGFGLGGAGAQSTTSVTGITLSGI
jgi:hypothetical protein